MIMDQIQVKSEADTLIPEEIIEGFQEEGSEEDEQSYTESQVSQEEYEEPEEEAQVSIPPEDDSCEKIDLCQFLERNGQKASFSEPIESLRQKKAFLERDITLTGQVSYSRHLLFFSLVSMENLTVNFLDSDFEGFANQIQRDIYSGSFDEDLRELCKKYCSSVGRFGPELRLVFGLMMSAATYKITKGARSSTEATAPVTQTAQESEVSQGNDMYQKYVQDLLA